MSVNKYQILRKMFKNYFPKVKAQDDNFACRSVWV
jgi:hypothetical protein